MAVAGIAAVIRRREAIRIVIARALCARGNLGKAVTISPRVPCYPAVYREIAPQGHFLALRAQGATSAYGLLAMTNLVASRHGIYAANTASLHGAHRP